MPPFTFLRSGFIGGGSGSGGGGGASVQPDVFFYKDWLDAFTNTQAEGESLTSKYQTSMLSSMGYDGALGFGLTTDSSSVYALPGLGNFSLRGVAQCVDGASHEFGFLGRLAGAQTGDDSLGFIYARMDDDVIKLSRMWRVNGVTDTLTLDSAALAVDSWDTLSFVLTANGDDYTLDVQNLTQGSSVVSLSGTDSTLPVTGFSGIRTGFSNGSGRQGWFKYVEVVEFGKTHTPRWNSSLIGPDLVAVWLMEEGTGNRLDAFGKGNTLSQKSTAIGIGAAPAALPRAKDAALFDGDTTKSLRIADNADVSMGDFDFSIHIRVLFTSLLTDQCILAKNNGVDGGREYHMQYLVGSNRLSGRVYDGTGVPQTTGTTVEANTLGAVSADTWYSVVFAHDATNDEIMISVDGGAWDTVSHTTGVLNGTADFTVGILGSDLRPTTGRIRDVMLWKRLLTDGERATLAAETFPFN